MDNKTAVRIRETAHDLIAERGYSGFSYADIADVVGIRKASIHHHYASKADLVVATLREHRERLVEASRDLKRTVADPLQRIHLYVQYWAECVRSNNRPICIAALLSAELPSLPAVIQAEVQAHFRFLVSWVEVTLDEGVRHGNIRLQQTPDVEAQSFVALVHGAMISARALGSPVLFTEITNGALERFRASG